MIKTLMISAALLAGTTSLALADMGGLQTGRSVTKHHTMKMHKKGTGIAANGRCGGVSYGTGQRGCGTATGGPVGGLAGKN